MARVTGDGGGDLGFARELEERRERVRGWAGSVDRPRPEPVWLNQARWAGWVKWAKAHLLKPNSNFKFKCYYLLNQIEIQN
jgi:hypothetical protein